MQLAKTIAHSALNLLFPPQCLACEAQVGAHGTLCTPCWHVIHFLSDPLCARCGAPLEFATGDMPLCTDCVQRPPLYTCARAAMRYDPASKALILKLKYQDETALSVTLGQWLAKTAAPFLGSSDYIVPVPLHYRRFVQRRYNQSVLLAKAMARATGKPLLADALIRTRFTQPQAALKGKARWHNVAGAFSVSPRHAERLRGKNVLLVDDVFTTGATLKACTEALHAARVRDVYIVTLARRVRIL